MQTTLITDPKSAGILLAKGALVGFATETVYGLGADARNDTAVARIFEAKGRPTFNPLIVHVPDLEAAQTLVAFNETALELARHFWPGPLTLVLPLTDKSLSPLVTAGLPTLAIRVPAHAQAQAVLRAAGTPIAAPSANPSGRISPTTSAHVMDGLSGRVDAVLEGGACVVGLESTIIGFEPAPVLLRQGGLSQDRIEQAIGPLKSDTTPAAVQAPGQLASHYAPQRAVRLNAQAPEKDEVFLGFGPMTSNLNLSESADLVEAAANLFGHLHQLDALDRPIAVAPIPEIGLGRAINDRLRRAAAPR
ncbi:L-threonylcarbamoyladenylate synthase [Nereida sp. MMG025]|uniref:L-threonylcarbamoyladenylate synthase n=1 Tax=Nereida sp. MMG025 TaxID=2909981 RepID=UPI001F0115F2|nr:L-threonylcarbamoyladenylate synthase [Nereida sp. MMG025]MCF6444377.1 threonylcarbamoyl-AMP synthase [Nereida sp. MMG025]